MGNDRWASVVGPFAEGFEGGAEVFGEVGGEGGGGGGEGVDEGELVGVEGEAGDEGAFFLEFADFVVAFEFGEEQFFAAVVGIDGEWVAHGFEVDADLMAAAGDGEDFEEGDAPAPPAMADEAFGDDPFGAGFFGLAVAGAPDDHAVFVVGVLADGEVGGAGFLDGGSADEGEIFLGDGACAELLGEVFLGGGGFGEEDEAGGVGVDAVDEEGLGFGPGEGGVVPEEVEEVFGAAAAGEDGESRGFVDGEESVVGVEDGVGGHLHRAAQ